jgi:3-oxoacyl-[acyl-carrier-protein] synthase II
MIRKGASRPFDVDRDGFVMGEGAGALILEEYEHAKGPGRPYLCGAGRSGHDGRRLSYDGYPPRRGRGLAGHAGCPEGRGNEQGKTWIISTCMLLLLRWEISASSRRSPAFRTGVRSPGDQRHQVHDGTFAGGRRGHRSHCLSVAIRDGIIPPTINTRQLDPAIPSGLNILLGEAQERPVNVAMSNTFGFGGHNGIVVFKKV